MRKFMFCVLLVSAILPTLTKIKEHVCVYTQGKLTADMMGDSIDSVAIVSSHMVKFFNANKKALSTNLISRIDSIVCYKENIDEVEVDSGLIINEISAHKERGTESWVELLNTSASTMDISGVGLYIFDDSSNGKCLWQAANGTSLGSGQRLILTTADMSLAAGIASNTQFELRLAKSVNDTAIDVFSRSAAFTAPEALHAAGSYQRIPDGSKIWRNLTYPSRGQENKAFCLDDTQPHAIWAWSSHVSSMMANNYAVLKNLKTLGYDHIILNYAAFKDANAKATKEFIAACEHLGITVHAWIQCFHNSDGWINPVDDANNCYKDSIFADIVSSAKSYIEDFGVKGIHLDYIRYPGTAYKHNPSAEVTAVGAVTRCCREIRELVDTYDEGIVTSAALMPEESGAYYYGQNYNQMGTYLHILMPMIYKYSYGYSDTRCVNIANMFAANTGGAAVWAGTTTYTGNDSGVTPMDADHILADIKVYQNSKAKGIVLFRYGLGTFPDVNGLWPKE